MYKLVPLQRSNLFQKDAMGHTSLHLAAKAGHMWLCWKLLEHGGYKLLMELNNDGYTAVDLARHGVHFR